MNKITKKIAGFVAALALVVSATNAGAQTTAELQAQINALMAQLSAMTGASSGAAMSAQFTSDMGMGATGGAVSSLQNFLIANGYSIPAGATGHYGAQTAAAVKLFQAAKGVPTTGYVGPLTRAALNASSTVVGTPSTGTPSTGTPSTGTPSTSDLEGTDGSISDVNELSQYSDEEVGEGQEEVKVAAFEVEASNDGDIMLKSVKIAFDPAGNESGDSSHLDDYISGVKIWQGSTEVGSADVEDFSENSSDVWTRTITLSDSIVRADETEKFYITVDGANSFDSSDINADAWIVDVDNIRFEDGSGVVTTETGYDIDGMNVEIDFVSFSSSADTELKVKLSSDSPDAQVVLADDEDDTEGVSLLKGTLEAEGDSDVVLDELPVTFTVTGATDVDFVTSSVTLKIGGEEYTETVSTSAAAATVVFDNLELTIDAGDTIDFEVLADINDTDSNFEEGDTLKAEITSTNRDYIDAENEEGDQLVDSTEKSGTALGDAQAFYVTGIKVTFVSESTNLIANDNAADNDTGEFLITYKVEAFGDTIYVSDSAAATTATSISATTVTTNGVLYLLDEAGTATTSDVSATVTFTTADGATDSGITNGVELAEGESTNMTLKVTRTNATANTDADGQYRVLLKAIGWATSDTSTFNVYDFDLEDFKTDPYITLN